MLSNPNAFSYHLNKFYEQKVIDRKKYIANTIDEIAHVVFDVLKEVELQEPRFISQLNEVNGRYEGISVLSPNEYEVVLYLNQMGVFNFVDDTASPGCALLKLSDGRKRSMSLWVEFITASGYLSARKIRARFHSLVAQACDKCSCKDLVKLIGGGGSAIDSAAGNTEVRLRIRDKYTVHVVPAFKCSNIWPRFAAHWPSIKQWPPENLISEVKLEGFHLLSKELASNKDKHHQVGHQHHHHQQQIHQPSVMSGQQSSSTSSSSSSSSEGDSWSISFLDSEDKLIVGASRRRLLSILKTLRDRHLDLSSSSSAGAMGTSSVVAYQQPINYYTMKTLVLYECEKHPHEWEWDEPCLGERLNGCLLQLVCCLQSRRFPAYFLPQVDLFRGKDVRALDLAAKITWRLLRELLFNPRCLDEL